MDKLWEKFFESGSVLDYLRYIKSKKSGERNDDVKGTGA